MTSMLSPAEVESFTKFASANLYADGDSETSTTKPYQVIAPFSAISTESESTPTRRAHSRSSSSSEAHCDGNSKQSAEDAHQFQTMRERFIETTPKYMRCTDRLDFGHSLERKANALGCKYVNPNSQNFVRWQFFDLVDCSEQKSPCFNRLHVMRIWRMRTGISITLCDGDRVVSPDVV